MFVNTPQQLAEKKLLLLYILDKVQHPLTNQQINQLVLENDIMDYFMLQQFLGELKDSSFIIEEDGKKSKICHITDKGKNTLDYFNNRIPNHQKSGIDKILEKKKEELKQRSEIKADYIETQENEYMVKLSMIEDSITIISLKLNVATLKQAKEICEKWKKNPDDIYKKIIDAVI